ncbi:MAG: Ig-like domain-containing protein, partial [Verrucomicrobiales bacterium]|nr:Ig-like domain-containing protein [Verrucomicrobiales bacterium]
ISAVDTPINGSVVLNGDGSVTFTPNQDYSGLAFFNYTASDGVETDSATVVLNFTAVNDAPVAVDDGPLLVPEDFPLSNIYVLSNDSDPEGNFLSVQGTPTANHGVVTVNPNNSINYTPDLNYNGPDVITYVVSDPYGATDTGTVAISVLSLNDAPEATDDSASSANGVFSVFVLTNDSDPDGNSISITHINGMDSSSGSPVQIATNITVKDKGGGELEIVNTGGAYAGDFTYTISDGNGSSDSATVSFSIGVAPVVIDRDGDGVEFVKAGTGYRYDIDSDGVIEALAWAGSDDGVLIHDANGNGEIDDSTEFAFSEYASDAAATDLEGLREEFDSNADGVLDKNDEKWEEFAIWQDRNGDGRVDEGEMTGLNHLGIESIGLVSDENSYSAADGDVFVHGEAEVFFSDGRVGVAADALFAAEGDDQFDPLDLEIITNDGEVFNLDGVSGLDQVPAQHGFDEIGEPGGALPAMDDEAARAAAEGGF